MSADLPVLVVLGASVAVGRVAERVRLHHQPVVTAVHWTFENDERAPLFFRLIRARSEVGDLVAAEPEGLCWDHDGVQQGPIRVDQRFLTLEGERIGLDEVIDRYARPPYLEILTERGIASVEIGADPAVQWWVERLEPRSASGSSGEVPVALERLRLGTRA